MIPLRPIIGEMISGQYWTNVAGSSSLHATAANLTSTSTQLKGILSGHQVNSGVMQFAWQGPTGQLANTADTPQQLWLAASSAQLDGAATAVQGLATAFDAAQMATPHPAAFAQNDYWYPIWYGVFIASLGIISQPLVANNAEHAAYTTAAVTADAGYKSTSMGILAALQPLALTPPPLSGTPGAPSISPWTAVQPLGPVLQGAAALGATPAGAALPALSAAAQPLSAAAQPLGAATSLLSQPSNALASSGGQLASTAAPMTSGLGGAPSSAMTPVGSQGAGSGGPGTNDGSWYGATATGGTVAAALSSGGGVGLGGLGGAGAAMAPLRGPVSWASATPEADQPVVSQFAQTRAALAASPTSANMGAPGTMMPPAARQGQESSSRDKALDNVLATAAVLYRPPKDMPVVTGAAGMHYLAGEEDQ
jgi:hypothetical protein